MKNTIYNKMKLSVYRPMFQKVKVLIIGAGAVGAALMEFLAKMGVSPDAIDYDKFTLENAAKHSCLVRTPEDVERNKAECVSSRAQAFLEEGCSSNGIDGELSLLGPEAFTDYDVIACAVDNYDAKILLNEFIRQLPEERRPVIVMGGTYDELAQSVISNQKDFCLRCLIDERSMKSSSIHTSCTGPQIRQINGKDEIVRTSNLASSMCAHLMAEQIRGYVIGEKNVMNKQLIYTAYPNLELSIVHPRKKNNCPGCQIKPPAQIEWLQGSVLELTLEKAIKQISNKLNTDNFEILTYKLNYQKIVYSGFIVDDVCHCCGKPIHVMKHEGRTFPDDLLCDECKSKERKTHHSVDFKHGTLLHAFTENSMQEVKQKTLFKLGFPLGAHIEVIQRNGALDYLDTDKIVKTTFACEEDHKKMHVIHQLKQ